MRPRAWPIAMVNARLALATVMDAALVDHCQRAFTVR